LYITLSNFSFSGQSGGPVHSQVLRASALASAAATATATATATAIMGMQQQQQQNHQLEELDHQQLDQLDDNNAGHMNVQMRINMNAYSQQVRLDDPSIADLLLIRSRYQLIYKLFLILCLAALLLDSTHKLHMCHLALGGTCVI